MTVVVGARNLFKADAGVVHALLQARYYDGSKGEFLSEDPSYLAVGNPNQVKQITGQDQSAFLADPQQSNSYGYARDNPITRSDPAGNSSNDPFMGAFTWGGGDPASASARQQAYAQVQAGLQGYYSAAKASTAVVASAGAVVVDPRRSLMFLVDGRTLLQMPTVTTRMALSTPLENRILVHLVSEPR